MLNFTKMQATGNDFVVARSQDDRDSWSDMARKVCDRRFGIGADGLLLVLPSRAADLRMRIFNPDGSEAEACGNGTRCVARYALNKGIVPGDRNTLSIETMGGVRNVGILPGGMVQVGMGAPRFQPQEIPVAPRKYGAAPVVNYPLVVEGRELRLDFVSMGNPHAVCFIDEDPADFPLSRLGPMVEHDPLFPQRVNFEIVKVLEKGRVSARVWERGAGETLSCGSGACAIGVASRGRGYTADATEVRLPGGTLHIRWDGAGQVLMSGPASAVFEGSWAGA